MEKPIEKKVKINFQELDENPAINIINVEGYVDSYNSKFFQETILNHISSGNRNLVMDCTSLSYLSSAGIGSFVAISEELKDNGFLILYNVNPKVLEVFTLLGFTRFFNITNNYDEAVNKAIELMGDSSNSNTGADKGSGEVVFPFNFECKVCGKKLKAGKPGNYNCPLCQNEIKIDKNGNISFG